MSGSTESPADADSATGDNFTLSDHNTFKCWMAVMEYGKQTLMYIFKWGYTKPSSQIEQEILKCQSGKQYRREFDSVQKEKIRKGNVHDFDITLLYLLLQRVCGLPPPNDPAWTTETPENPLPYLLNLIKKNRNELAHAKTSMNFNKMSSKLDYLLKLFLQALDETGKEFSVSKEDIQLHKEKIETGMLGLKSTNMDRMALADTLQTSFKEKTDLTKTEARVELQHWYLRLCKICLELPENRQCNVEDVFTPPLIKHENESTVMNEVPEEGVVDLRNVFRAKTTTGEIPAIILLLSNSGFGKTTLAKYILYCWINGFSDINDLDQFDLVLYIDFRGSYGLCLDDYLKEILPKTVAMMGISELKTYMMSMEVLFILDNIDNVKNDKKPMLDEIFRFKSTGVRCLATATQNVPSTFNSKSSPHHKSSLPLHLKGLHGEKIGTCINKLYENSSIQSPEAEAQIEDFCSRYISNTKPTFGVFHSPEILSYMFSQWVSENTPPSQHITKTRLYLINLKLLQMKIWNQANHTEIYEKMSFQKNIDSLLDAIALLAFQNVKTSPLVSFEHFEGVMNLGRNLSVPYENILKSIFIVEDIAEPSAIGTKFPVSFRSVSHQFFFCALHIIKHMFSDANLEPVLSSVLLDISGTISSDLLLKFMMGLITSGSFSDSESKLSKFLLFLNDSCNLSNSSWLDLLEESNQKETVLQVLRGRFGNHWSFQNISSSYTLTKLFSEKCPETLKLSFTDLHCCENICPILRASSKVLGMQLSLHIFCHAWMRSQSYSDEYLEETHSLGLYLKSFAGKLSSKYYPFLPNTLQSLALQLSPSDIPLLNKVISSMNSLKMLFLIFFMEIHEENEPVSRIWVPKRETVFSVDIWNARADDVAGACNFASKISEVYCRLVLRRTNFTFASAKEWVSGLCERRIHVDTLVIGSTNPLEPQEENTLRNMALDFECSEFKWLKLDST